MVQKHGPVCDGMPDRIARAHTCSLTDCLSSHGNISGKRKGNVAIDLVIGKPGLVLEIENSAPRWLHIGCVGHPQSQQSVVCSHSVAPSLGYAALVPEKCRVVPRVRRKIWEGRARKQRCKINRHAMLPELPNRA